MTADHSEATRMLASQASCTDAVIARLETLGSGRADGALLSDLSAAYYVRAQRRNRPADLLRALDAAGRAVAAAPTLLEAKFNRALAEEALDLDHQAIASWSELQKIDRTQWGVEAGEREQRLVGASSIAALTQWSLNQRRLAERVVASDPAAVAQLIAPFPAAAQRYVEDELLPAWAIAAQEHRQEDARYQLDLVLTIAAQQARLTGDRYLLDIVTRVRQSSGAQAKSLQAAHVALRDGHAEERLQPKEAVENVGAGRASRSRSELLEPAHARRVESRELPRLSKPPYRCAFAL